MHFFWPLPNHVQFTSSSDQQILEKNKNVSALLFDVCQGSVVDKHHGGQVGTSSKAVD